MCGAHDSWSLESGADGDSLVASFVGPTSTPAFHAFLAELSERMPERSARLWFDLRRLDGYNPETKEPMKAWLLANKLAIAEVVVVVRRSETLLKVVTAAVGLAVGVKIRISEVPAGAELSTKAATV